MHYSAQGLDGTFTAPPFASKNNEDKAHKGNALGRGVGKSGSHRKLSG